MCPVSCSRWRAGRASTTPLSSTGTLRRPAKSKDTQIIKNYKKNLLLELSKGVLYNLRVFLLYVELYVNFTLS